MVGKTLHKRSPGRPQAFHPDEALDRAVEMFWTYGYERVDVDRIARAVNVTKPALYRAFGDKASLLVKAVQRYAELYGAPIMQAFLTEPDINKAVRGFCEMTVNMGDGAIRAGCMMAAAAVGQSERVDDIRAFAASSLTASADLIGSRFQAEIDAGRLSADIPAMVRGRALIDLSQGIMLRTRLGVSRNELLKDALSYVPLILGAPLKPLKSRGRINRVSRRRSGGQRD
jgi:AcrR family transcriptional regulator